MNVKATIYCFQFSLWLFLLSNGLLAQNSIEFERFNTENGLTQNVVESIYQDAYGFLWFGTLDGLNRFDGHTFVNYHANPKDSTSLSHNFITSITQSDSLVLWIGTYGGGLNKLDLTTNQFVNFSMTSGSGPTLPDNVVYEVQIDGDSLIWVGTKRGLVKLDFNNNSSKTFRFSEESVNANVIYSIYLTDQFIWAGGREGLYRINRLTNEIKEYVHNPDDPNSLLVDDIRVIYPKKDGNFFIGTRGGGIHEYDQTTDQFLHHKNSYLPQLSGNYVRAILLDDQDNLLVGTFGGGLAVFNLKSHQLIEFKNNPYNDNSLSDNRVISLHQDQSGSFWVGTYEGGVNRFKLESKRFDLISEQDQFGVAIKSNVNCLFSTDSEIYIGSNDGIKKVDTLSNSLLEPSGIYENKVLNGKRVWRIFEDSKGHFWISVWGEGLYRFNGKDGSLVDFYSHTLGEKKVLSANYVETIAEDKQGRIWFGMVGDGGLMHYDRSSDSWHNWMYDSNVPNSLSNNRVNNILVDLKGRVWIATDFGLNRWREESQDFELFWADPKQENSLNYNFIISLYQSKVDSIIWIGTGGGGLNKMTEKNGKFVFENYTSSLGLINNNIKSVVEDDNGNLWLATYHGISKFNPKSLHFSNYETSDGLQGLEFTMNTAIKAHDGSLYFGGVHGLNRAKPERIKDYDYLPPVILTKISILGSEGRREENIFYLDEIDLYPGDAILNIEFSGLDFDCLDLLNFKYSMSGLDHDEVPLGNRRFLVFTNLSPGEYDLKIFAANRDGIWNPEPYQLKIVVHPAFWQTLWFKILAFILLIIGIIVYVRLRISNLKNIQIRLERMVSLRTNELEVANKKLLKQQKLLSTKNQEIINNLEEIQSQRDQILRKNSELENAQKTIKLQNDQLKIINTQLEDVVDERTSELRNSNIELTAVNKELDTFFYKASHDLKGPVATIQGLCYLAEKDTDSEKIKIYLNKIGETALHMNKLLFNLQKLNKIKLGTLSPEKAKITELIWRAYKTVIPAEDERKYITFEIQDEATDIITDVKLFSLIIENLISNAIKFVKKGEDPFIRFEVKQREDGMLSIKCMDKGQGISDDHQGRVFELFFVGQEEHGYGLGLYSVKMAVKKLKGEVELVSDPNFATVFEIVLPARIYAD